MSSLMKFEKRALVTVSKATKNIDRRVEHIRQLFAERVKRAEADYYESMRRVFAPAEAVVDPTVADPAVGE